MQCYDGSIILFYFIFFFHSIYYPRTTLALLPSSTLDPGSHIGPFLPPPHYGTCLHFYREKNSAFSSLVDSRRIAGTVQIHSWELYANTTEYVAYMYTMRRRSTNAVPDTQQPWRLLNGAGTSMIAGYAPPNKGASSLVSTIHQEPMYVLQYKTC